MNVVRRGHGEPLLWFECRRRRRRRKCSWASTAAASSCCSASFGSSNNQNCHLSLSSDHLQTFISLEPFGTPQGQSLPKEKGPISNGFVGSSSSKCFFFLSGVWSGRVRLWRTFFPPLSQSSYLLLLLLCCWKLSAEDWAKTQKPFGHLRSNECQSCANLNA